MRNSNLETLANGLRAHKRRVPLGVLGVIYESRPNVTIDVACLALKTGNAVILRGGSETLKSNRALVEVVHQALRAARLPVDAVQFIDDPDRARVTELLHLDEFVDLIIPRGGNSLHEFCRRNSTIPVITGGIGICHLFVDETVDLDAACRVIRNAKIQRPTVCNALDTVLVHRSRAAEFLPALVSALSADGVEFRADPSAVPYLASGSSVSNATTSSGDSTLPKSVHLAGPQDFDTEWLSLVLGLKVVESLTEAIEHIHVHSTGHSDGILTSNDENARRFIQEVELGCRLRQRQHSIHGWQPARPGSRSGSIHATAARAGPNGAARTDDLQMGCRRRLPRASLKGGSAASARAGAEWMAPVCVSIRRRHGALGLPRFHPWNPARHVALVFAIRLAEARFEPALLGERDVE